MDVETAFEADTQLPESCKPCMGAFNYPAMAAEALFTFSASTSHGMAIGRTSKDLSVLMKPEGSTKIVVLNGSRQIGQILQGEWMTMKVDYEAGLSKGIYQSSDATRTAKNVHPHEHVGKVLHADEKHVYQFSGNGIVQHERSIFEKTPVVGENYEVSYRRGVGTVKGVIDRAQADKLTQSQKHGRGI